MDSKQDYFHYGSTDDLDNFVTNILTSQHIANPIDWLMRNVPSKHHIEVLEITMQLAQDAGEKGEAALQDKILTSAMNTAQQLKYVGQSNEALMILKSAIKYDLEYNHQPLVRWGIQQNILQINQIDETITWLEKNNCTIASQAQILGSKKMQIHSTEWSLKKSLKVEFTECTLEGCKTQLIPIN